MYVPVLDDGLIWGKALDRGSGNMLPDPCLQTKQSVFLRPNLTFHEIGALSTMTGTNCIRANHGPIRSTGPHNNVQRRPRSPAEAHDPPTVDPFRAFRPDHLRLPSRGFRET